MVVVEPSGDKVDCSTTLDCGKSYHIFEGILLHKILLHYRKLAHDGTEHVSTFSPSVLEIFFSIFNVGKYSKWHPPSAAQGGTILSTISSFSILPPYSYA